MLFTRRKMLGSSALGMVGLAGGTGLGLSLLAENQRDVIRATKDIVTRNAQAAIDSGLSYLAHSANGGRFGEGQYRGNVAVTSLAGLAFLANGSQPGRGRYGTLLLDTVKYVLRQSRPYGRQFKGFLHNPAASPHGPMYEHGFGTLFLAEVYGMVHDNDLRAKLHVALENAIDLIMNSQNREGGWRYKPTSSDADISVTICQIMALRAARNAGFAVKKDVVDRCVAYVKRCQDPVSGGFRYQAQRRGGFGSNRAFARTAAGVCALYSAGIYKGPEVEKGLRYLMQSLPSGRQFGPADMQYFYGHYYAAQAAWTAGGEYWSRWYPAIRNQLVDSQRPQGSWDDRLDDHYGTAMACIILQIPNNYLPILQK